MQADNLSATSDKLDAFARRHSKFLDVLYENSGQGCDLTLSWCDKLHAEHPPIIQSITMVHPFHIDQFDYHAFDEAAGELGLDIDYIEKHNKNDPLRRWLQAAESIVRGADGGDIDSNMRFVSTRNTLNPQNPIRTAPKYFRTMTI